MMSISCSWWPHLPPLLLATHQEPLQPAPRPRHLTSPCLLPLAPPCGVSFPVLPAGASTHHTEPTVGHCWVYSILTLGCGNCTSPCLPPTQTLSPVKMGPVSSSLLFACGGDSPQSLNPWTHTPLGCEFAVSSCPARWR